MSETLPFLYDVAEIAVPVGAIPFVARAHRPHVALGWLVFLAFLPLTGLAAYLYFGRLRLRHQNEAKQRVEQCLGPMRAAIVDRFRDEPPDHDAMDLRRLARRIASGHASAPLRGNLVEILDEQAFVERLVEDISRARSRVELLYYLFVDDEIGRRVGTELAAAARRGVQCRLLVGSISSWLEGQRSPFAELGPELEEAGVEVVPLRPVGPIRNRIQRVDLRNHRKIAVIDGTVAYAGSQNIHAAGNGGAEAWKQMNARVEGPAAAMLRSLFLADWYLEREIPESPERLEPPPERGDAHVQVVGSRHVGGPSELRRLFVGAVHEARSELTICTPYFAPDEATLLALEIAVARGVEVRLVVPARSDKWYADAATRAFLDALVPVGVRVHRYQPGMLHAKLILVDGGIAYVGSGNVDRRSMFLDDEVGVLLSDSRSIRRIREILDDTLADSAPVSPADWAARPRLRQYADHCCKLFSPVL